MTAAASLFRQFANALFRVRVTTNSGVANMARLARRTRKQCLEQHVGQMNEHVASYFTTILSLWERCLHGCHTVVRVASPVGEGMIGALVVSVVLAQARGDAARCRLPRRRTAAGVECLQARLTVRPRGRVQTAVPCEAATIPSAGGLVRAAAKHLRDGAPEWDGPSADLVPEACLPGISPYGHRGALEPARVVRIGRWRATLDAGRQLVLGSGMEATEKSPSTGGGPGTDVKGVSVLCMSR